jgi:hypothetical protein
MTTDASGCAQNELVLQRCKVVLKFAELIQVIVDVIDNSGPQAVLSFLV